jgi:large subunit ribosomal protein L4
MTTELKQYNLEGKENGKLSVSETVFGLDHNEHVLYLALKRELANGRAGTANSKTRAQVRGGGKKPWKQKGTGRARAGSIRSPLWVGGGVIFGPQPRSFSIKLPKKVARLAIRTALSNATEKTFVIQDFSFLNAPKTKEVATLLKKLGLEEKKVLLLANYKAEANQHLYLASRNIANLKLSLPSNLSVKDLLGADAVVATAEAIQEINERYQLDG